MTPEQLKASILQRAMEGKLVPQNPDGEPASELLKRIKAEKEKLISEGKIKRDKKETEIFRGDDGKPYEKFADGSIQEIDVPYDIPDSWEWVRFSTLVEIVRGGSPRPIKDYLTSEVDGINWIKIGDTKKGEKYINNVKEKIKKSGLNKTRFVKKGTFLLTNSMSFGRPYILNVDGAIHDGWLAILNYENSLNRDYLFYILSSNVVYYQFLSLINGAVVKNLNSDKVASILIPLPPLTEQQRIVEAIESALEKVDEYAESYNRLEQLDKEFPDKLKKSILQYAMQGKLVEQDPNDEPVEVLLEKIRAEKQKLFKEGKIKKKDLEISIVSQGDDNSPYGKIPENWLLSTLDSVSNLYTGNSINATEKKKYFSGVDGVNYIATKDVNFDSTINYDNGIRIPDRYLSKFKISYSNSVLLCLEGGSAGRKIGLLEQDVCFGNKLCSLSFYYGENKWLYYFLQSPQFLSDFQESKSGIIGGVSIKNLGNITISLPPQKEQKCTSSKVEKLFEKVNQLWK
ncbi:restriction endonuclease subunit S [Streptococcus anginosus]|nr:restriction endonuclease subunit S [Streptococcus anginosus]MDX5025522.1 restriction endonuclease subunit S [Streptococcus anginosus]MDX5034598.1 restriction endonuclease subunit S [Streptococcus anginosus]